jgi:hypothetical protein
MNAERERNVNYFFVNTNTPAMNADLCTSYECGFLLILAREGEEEKLRSQLAYMRSEKAVINMG